MLTPMADDTLRLVAFGGLGEIGLNLLALETGGRILLIDGGLMFPEPHLPGIDLVLPDVSALVPRRGDIAGWLLTHGHEDHIGALPYLWPLLDRPPLYGSRLTLELVRARLEERGLGTDGRLLPLHPGETLPLPPFTVEPFRVAHSTSDCLGFGLRTPQGLVVHTGDFKLDPAPLDGQPTDLARLKHYGDEGVRLLLADSTNIEHDGPPQAEAGVGATLRELLPRCGGRVLVSTFSSNIQRIQQILDAAVADGRRVLVHGRSLESTVAIARRLGYLRVADERLVSLRQADGVPHRQLLILTTGSQGEPLSALTRIALGEHAQLKLVPGDTVILSSKFIPGNEKAIGHLIDQLYRRGAEVLDEKVSPVHVSGHAGRGELETVHRLLRPRHFVPVHGEYRHLCRHARAARQWQPEVDAQVLEDGVPLLLDAGGARTGERIPVGRVLVDGKGVGDLGEPELRDRRHVAHHGLAVAVLTLDGDGALACAPELFTRGLLPEERSREVLNEATEMVRLLAAAFPGGRDGVDELREEVRLQLRRFFNRRLARRPLVLPVIVQF